MRGNLFGTYSVFNEGAVESHRANPRQVQAMALSKRTAGALCFISFEMLDGSRMEMGVSKRDYDRIKENDRCVLTIENGQCIGIESA